MTRQPPPVDVDVETLGPVATGPSAPLPFVTAPTGSGLPDGIPPGTPGGGVPLVVWVGCHGGAGESTLAALLPGSAAAGHRWPAAQTGLPGRPVPVVLVTRTSHTGLAAAQAALTQWAARDTPTVDLLGLVLSADAPGRLPGPLRDYARLVAGGAPRTWSLPWIDAWRTGEPAAPRPVARLLGQIGALLPPNRCYPDPARGSDPSSHPGSAPRRGAPTEGC